MSSKPSALILQGNNSTTSLRGDWRNHAREVTSPSGGRRPSIRFRLAMLEWRSQTRDGLRSIFLHPTQPNPTQPTILTEGPNPTHPSHTYVKCRHQYCRTHIFYMSFISQRCLLKNKGKRMSSYISSVLFRKPKKTKVKDEK